MAKIAIPFKNLPLNYKKEVSGQYTGWNTPFLTLISLKRPVI
jgi:hypothetical protein